jgi:putative addiction module component (TIGR02574 family)
MAAPANLIAEIFNLPVEDRAQLALDLIRSLEDEVDDDAAEQWAAEIDRRSAEVEAGTAPTVTLPEYREHVRRRRAARAR